jgi:signal transduction histidine kinase
LYKRKDIPFHGVYLLFVAFILLCGITHLMDAIIFWWPAYRLSALIRLLTAIVSVFTIYALYKILPSVFSLRSVSELEAEINKRHIVEEKLAASEFLLSEAGKISRVGGWEIDLITRSKTWSQTVYDIFELPYEYSIDHYNPIKQVQLPYREALKTAIRAAILKGSEWDMELTIVTAEGKTIWVRSTGKALYDQSGKRVKILGTLMDIDRYKINEIALNKSLELTTQNNQQLKNFTHILSHNIRNHASNMVLISSLIDTESLDEYNAALFEKIKNVSDGLNATLEDLSQAIKIKENPISSELISFRTLTEKVLDIFESDLKVNNVQVEQIFESEQVNFPRIYLESILTNLVSNAIKYRNPDCNASIILKTYRNDQMKTVLECRDNGLGIDLELHGKKLFGLYKTFHERKDAHGVGLFLTKTQIESQGGQIQVESQPGKGSVFKIIFNE